MIVSSLLLMASLIDCYYTVCSIDITKKEVDTDHYYWGLNTEPAYKRQGDTPSEAFGWLF